MTEYFRILKQVVVEIVNYLKRLYALSAAFHCFQIINLARKLYFLAEIALLSLQGVH